MKNKKGITLITLVITIIVLLILAAVAIRLVAGGNGTITKADDAANETVVADAKEQAELYVAACVADYYSDLFEKGNQEPAGGVSGYIMTQIGSGININGGYTLKLESPSAKVVEGKPERIASLEMPGMRLADATFASGIAVYQGDTLVVTGSLLADGSIIWDASPRKIEKGTASPRVMRTITYDANGGTGTMSNQTVPDGYSVTLSRNTFTKGDYLFNGWSDGTNTYTDGQTITVTGDLNLTAQWLLPTYKITYNANGGEGTMEETTFTLGDTVNLRKNTFTRTDYQFNGWTDGTNNYTDEQSVTLTGNLNLTAKWLGTSTITYDANGGSGTMNPTVGVNPKVAANGFTAPSSAYYFDGWNTASDGSRTKLCCGCCY